MAERGVEEQSLQVHKCRAWQQQEAGHPACHGSRKGAARGMPRQAQVAARGLAWQRMQQAVSWHGSRH